MLRVARLQFGEQASTTRRTNAQRILPSEDVVQADDQNGLQEAIAEHAHEIWAENRQQEGWSYGSGRDDVPIQPADIRKR